MFNYLCTLQYNGKNFSGWVKQHKKTTIQGELEKAIKKVTKGSEVKTLGASKTDAGVHALCQKVILVLPFEPMLEGFVKTLNANLAPDINIKDITSVDENFRVRSCKEKTYKYSLNLGEYDLYTNDFEWRIMKKFNLNHFKDALNLFIGEHDFFNFSGIKTFEKETIRTIRDINSIEVTEEQSKIHVFIKGKGFIRYQIRMIIGAAVGYAIGKVASISDIKDVLECKKDKLNLIAPPCGLTLMNIIY